MKIIPLVALVVFDASLPLVLRTSCANAVRWGQPLVNIVHSVIVVFTNVRKMVLFQHCLTALLPPSIGTVRIVFAWLRSTYDHTWSTCPLSGLDFTKIIKIIKSS